MAEHSFPDQLRVLEEENSEDLEAVTRILSKLTHLSSEQIKPRLQSLITNLLDLQASQPEPQESSEAWTQRFTKWVEEHRELGLPSLSDEAISRESIYGDDR
ncbi:MAG: hypothetical protein KME10_15775 [Plectolyngbya sp. WJT66-NPBG17]|jgi:hypothetical protein|nr:hypothetical protein [Plectolyngbya sp. WJT66-NPBG17]